MDSAATAEPTTASGHAHAKAILVGEHFVLDGATAVAIGLPGFRTEVRVHRVQPGSLRVHFAPESAPQGTWADDTRKMLQMACELVGLEGEIEVTIASTVPLGRGLGSSAALAVAAVRAAERLHHLRDPADADLLADAREVECIVHGHSSGLDPAAAATDGAVLFRGGAVQERVAVAQVPALQQARWVLLDLGMAASTRAAIAAARNARGKLGDAAVHRLVAQTTAAAETVARALHAGDVTTLAEGLQAAGQALVLLGVVDMAMQVVIDTALEAGALAAKQTGAGLGGMLLALCDTPEAAGKVRSRCKSLTAGQWLVPVAMTEKK
jgi:mevalonate kinase